MDGDSEDLRLEPAQVIAAFTTFCTLYQKAFDEAALARECIPPLSVRHLAAIGQQLGLDVSVERFDLAAFAHPVLVQARTSNPEQGCEFEWLILLSQTDTTVSHVTLGAQQTREEPISELATRVTGRCLDIRPAAAQPQDPDQSPIDKQPFGFRWFVPELLKHKGIWREVLGASLVLQLMALGFPLFTQAIIEPAAGEPVCHI